MIERNAARYLYRPKNIRWHLLGDLLSVTCFTFVSITAWLIFLDLLMSVPISLHR